MDIQIIIIIIIITGLIINQEEEEEEEKISIIPILESKKLKEIIQFLLKEKLQKLQQLK